MLYNIVQREREREREREGAKVWDTERERMKCGEGYWRGRWDSTIGLVRQERRVHYGEIKGCIY